MSDILDRIAPIYQRNFPLESRDLVWDTCMAAAVQTPLTTENLDRMCQTSLVSGFGGGGGRPEIIRLAKALGVCGVSNPENDAYIGQVESCNPMVDHLPTDTILDMIQTKLPFAIDFPPFHGGCEQGTPTKYGVTADRHVFYLWVLKRIMELCPDRQSGILEIGAGFGVLGYYLDRAGYRDYTTVDLALINAVQSYFLMKNLPVRDFILSGEADHPMERLYEDSIKLLHATDFHPPAGRFDLMVNLDGLTEYGIEQATRYVQSDCAPLLISFNHEVNPYRVIDIPQPHRKLVYRYPFWLRPGYVEELYA